jgi:3-dehydroquinate dehydratase/shikimate dehydrogenase
VGQFPKTRFIVSHHDFVGVPQEWGALLHSLERWGAFHMKIAVTPRTTTEALRLLLWKQQFPHMSMICMGEKMIFARIVAAMRGNFLNFASLEEKMAPGQMALSEWFDIYHYPELHQKTPLYALIGNPIEKSPGHLYHNAAFAKHGLNAVYVKIPLVAEELVEFISFIRPFGVRGLSVTIPLKEKIVPLLDEIEPAMQSIGAINTVVLYRDRLMGTNTDGVGALDAIEAQEKVARKRVLLLGAGGAARAIAFEAKARGAQVWIANRTVERAKALAEAVGGEWGGLEEIPPVYDVVINSSSEEMPIEERLIMPGTLAMDVTYAPKRTLFLEAALRKNCRIVYGEEMFVNQAARQTAFWLAHLDTERDSTIGLQADF